MTDCYNYGTMYRILQPTMRYQAELFETAAQYGYKIILEILLKRPIYKQSLLRACCHGYLDIIKLLFNKCTNIDKYKNKLLIVAASYGFLIL